MVSALIAMHWTLQGGLWLLGFLLELTVAVAIFRRRLYQDYPLFFSYVVLELIRTIMLAAIRPHHPPYFYAYWISECLVALFGFLVVEEVFRKAFERRLGLQKLGTALFRYSLLALIVTAVAAAVMAPGTESDKLFAGILILKRTQSLVRVGLVVCLFLFVFLLGLPWGNYSVGIALGFAVHGVVESAAMIARSHYGSKFDGILVWSIMSVAVSERLIWVGYFLSPQAVHSRTLAQDKDYSLLPMTTEVSKMNEVVESLLSR
jgi:hypothetical protein